MVKGGKRKEVKVGKQIYVKMTDFTMGIYIFLKKHKKQRIEAIGWKYTTHCE